MYIDHRNPRLRRGFAFVALAAVLGLSAVSLTQCRMVNDTVTGVDLSAEVTDTRRASERYLQPSVLLRKRLDAQWQQLAAGAPTFGSPRRAAAATAGGNGTGGRPAASRGLPG